MATKQAKTTHLKPHGETTKCTKRMNNRGNVFFSEIVYSCRFVVSLPTSGQQWPCRQRIEVLNEDPHSMTITEKLYGFQTTTHSRAVKSPMSISLHTHKGIKASNSTFSTQHDNKTEPEVFTC